MSLQDIGDDADRILRDLEREIVVMKLIEHPNIMRLYDVWETSTDLYLILEYVEGGELFDYLCEKGKLGSPEASRLFQQIIAAMHYCHQVNIAHRDLKPENILLDKDKNIRIADFGMAAAWHGQDQLLQTACGSPHYAAPEVINQHAYDGSLADIWSCGVILFALVCGKLPFDDDDNMQVLEAVRIGKYKMPTDIDPRAQDLISKMLVYDPNQRISIPEILKHPFCTSEPLPKSLVSNMPAIEFPESPVLDVDPAIFANMIALWPNIGTDTLTANLTGRGSTWEKGVYRLLLRYRARHLEEYDEDEERQLVQRRKSRREARKAHSQKHKQKRSIDFLDLPPRDGPPTPRRASRARPTSDSRSSSPGLGGIQPVSLFSQSLLYAPQSSAAPTPTSSKADSAPEVQDVQLHTFLKQIAETLNVIQHTPKTQMDALSPIAVDSSPLPSALGKPFQEQETFGGLQPSRNVNTTRPLSIRRRATDKENSCDTTSYLTPDHAYRTRYADDKTPTRKSSLRTKDSVNRSDLRVQIKEPAKLRKRNSAFASPASSAFSTFSDAGSSIRAPSPKRSWLNNIFGFRPPSYQLLSSEDIHISRLQCKAVLEEMGVCVVLTQTEGMGVLKCRLEESKDPEGLMPTIKAVKFRVEMQRPSTVQAIGGTRAVLSWVMEKGAQSSFRLMFNRFRREWSLDASRVGAYGTSMRVSRDSSPILPQDERFVEVAFDGED